MTIDPTSPYGVRAICGDTNWRRTYKLNGVTIERHLNGAVSIWCGGHLYAVSFDRHVLVERLLVARRQSREFDRVHGFGFYRR